MTCANAWPIDANGGDLSCYCAIVRLVKDWNEIVGSVMDWQIGDELVDGLGLVLDCNIGQGLKLH